MRPDPLRLELSLTGCGSGSDDSGAVSVYSWRQEDIEGYLVAAAGWGNLCVRIFLPLMRPALGPVAIVSAVSGWNEFFFPLVLIRSEENRTLPLGLATMARQFIDDMTEGTR